MTFLISSIFFTFSCAQTFAQSLYTYLVDPPDPFIVNIGNMTQALTYLVAYILYVVAEWRAKKRPLYDEERLQLLINRR